MSKENDKRVCPVEMAGGLDNFIRRLLQNPKKILAPYISEGMTVLDLGCGPGFFTIEIAKMIGDHGKVIAADLQEGMLEKVEKKIRGTSLEQRVKIHKCESNNTGLTEKVDFVLCFYMIHEVPEMENLFIELKSLLKPEGKLLVIEPNFHVTKSAFDKMIHMTSVLGFNIVEKPQILLSRAVLLRT